MMTHSCLKILNIGTATLSLSVRVLLNILGAGGLWALKGVIESYTESNLNSVFRPIYFTSLGVLTAWQVLELSLLTKNQFAEEKNIANSKLDQLVLAKNHPVHYYWDSLKSCACCCGASKPSNISDTSHPTAKPSKPINV